MECGTSYNVPHSTPVNHIEMGYVAAASRWLRQRAFLDRLQAGRRPALTAPLPHQDDDWHEQPAEHGPAKGVAGEGIEGWHGSGGDGELLGGCGVACLGGGKAIDAAQGAAVGVGHHEDAAACLAEDRHAVLHGAATL